MDPVKRSLLSLHVTVILLSAASLFSILIPLNAIDITFGRSLFACIALLMFMLASRSSFKLDSRRCYIIATGLGVLMAAHWSSYFAAMQYAGVSVGMIALFTFPVITVLIEPFFEKFQLAWQDIVSGLVVLLGIYLIVPAPDLSDNTTLGVLIGIGSACLYALRNILHRKYFAHYGGAKTMFYQILVVCLCLVLFVSPEFYAADATLWIQLLVLGSLLTALPHALVAASLQHLRAKTFSLIACMQPFYGVILAILVLNENPSLSTLIGGILVVSASIYETLNAHHRPAQTCER
ncbi:DMT family transporter [Alteromonas facilis]|uniref:DMT family transporter n=1 Tax=Alteromonas facilis TaxID=2048004 RepID=UPI000C2877AA|nr:DMT family transporter [Alteromonas facilis]